MSVQLKTCALTAILVVFLGLMSFTSARFIQDTDDRDKRQVGDLRTAEILALITLDRNRLQQQLQLPSHCARIACGLVDVISRMMKRTMSDQRVAEILANIALSRGRGIPIAHGLLDPNEVGRRRRRSLDSVLNGMNDEQKYRLLNLLVAKDENQLS